MGVLSLVPIIGSFYVSIYGALSLFLRYTWPLNIITALLFISAHMYIPIVIDAAILDTEIVKHNSPTGRSSISNRPSGILMGIAFWLGFWQFGFPEGLVIGPLVISCVPIIISHLYEDLYISK